MQQDELLPVDEQTGELDQAYDVPKTATAVDHLSTVLIILTSLFLLLSIIMTSIQLYVAYDIGKSKEDIRERERVVRTK